MHQGSAKVAAMGVASRVAAAGTLAHCIRSLQSGTLQRPQTYPVSVQGHAMGGRGARSDENDLLPAAGGHDIIPVRYGD